MHTPEKTYHPLCPLLVNSPVDEAEEPNAYSDLEYSLETSTKTSSRTFSVPQHIYISNNFKNGYEEELEKKIEHYGDLSSIESDLENQSTPWKKYTKEELYSNWINSKKPNEDLMRKIIRAKKSGEEIQKLIQQIETLRTIYLVNKILFI